MDSTLPSQPPSPPIYLCFQQVTFTVHEMTPVGPFKHNVQKGLFFLKIQNQLVVQFRERSYSANTA